MDGWGQVAFWVAVALLLLVSQRWGARRMLAAAETADAKGREDVVRALTARGRLVPPVVLAVLTACYSAIVLLRGSPMGWGWAAAALIFGLASLQTLRTGSDAATRLGPPDLTEHERRRGTRTTRIMVVGAAAFVVSQVVVATVPDPRTSLLVGAPFLLVAVVSLLAAAWSGVWVGRDEQVRP